MSASKPLVGGEILVNDDGIRYLIDSKIGEGGFGHTYRAFRLSKAGSRRLARVCLKVCSSLDDWHCEAFFGRLLNGRDRAVQLLDAFVAGADVDHMRRHVLIFGGTVATAIEDKLLPWSEPKVRSEISGLLCLLAEMHNVGITHRDITPGNVFLRNGCLALGDFGISRMALNPREATVTAYTPAYVPRSMESRYLWGPAEDLYQVGLLTCTLLTGEDWDRHRINALRYLDAADDLKCWVWHVTSEKVKRYESAGAALDALQTLKSVRLDNGRMPASLRGERVVLTGSLETLTQPEAAEELRRAEATVQDAVADTTRPELRRGAEALRNTRAQATGAANNRRVGQPGRALVWPGTDNPPVSSPMP